MANQQPLADRIRPTTLDEVVGQKHLVGKNGILRRLLESGRIPNMIFSGPPGTGKTTCANIIAKASGMRLVKLNATTASLSDIREVTASTDGLFASDGVLLYLDEIQYFNKKQQQSLLEFLEDGRITMIASTTENPYLYIYNSILSRSSVFTFTEVSADECVPALRRALNCLNETFSGAIMAADFCKALWRRSQDTYLQTDAEMLGGSASLAENAGRFSVIEMVEDVVGAQINQLATEGVAVVELALREERLGFAEHDETVRMGQIQHKALKRRVFRHVVADD